MIWCKHRMAVLVLALATAIAVNMLGGFFRGVFIGGALMLAYATGIEHERNRYFLLGKIRVKDEDGH